MRALEQIFHFLFDMYGGQGWWPVTPVCGCRGETPAEPIYGMANITEKQRLEIIAGAVLTQNTAWKNAEKAIIELNRRGWIDVKKLRSVPEKELGQAILSSGYYNQKAKKLKAIADFLTQHSIQNLRKMPLQEARSLLLGVKGVGKETADSILLYALDKPIFVIDAYTRRIFSRLGLINAKADYDAVQKFFMDNLPHDVFMFKDYHALIVQHAKKYYQGKSPGKECPLVKKFAA